MKTRLLTLLTGLSLTILILVSCRPQVSCELTDEEKKAVAGEIETVVRNFLNASTLGYQSEIGLRADVEGYVMGGDGKIKFTSYDALDQYLKKAFANIQKFTEAEIVSLYIYVLAKDAAACTFLLHSKFLRTSGDTVVNNASWTMVLKKFDKAWKVVQENGTHTRE
jgi:hypothetical protein